MLIAANELEVALAAEQGLRVFDAPFGKSTITCDQWWIGEQTWHHRDNDVRLFAVPASGDHARADLAIGSTWTDEGKKPEFSHVIIAKAVWVTEFERDGIPYQRYIEVAE